MHNRLWSLQRRNRAASIPAETLLC